VNEMVKILFVDDEPNVLNAIKRILVDDDYEIYTAGSATEGVAIMKDNKVQVVVSDYRMPDINGIEFLREVNEHWPETVRIVLSGYADIASIVAAVNEGQIYKFIPKPWNDDELRITIANAAERYALFRRNHELAIALAAKNAELTRLNIELEDLLIEKTEHLEFRSNVLSTYQKILDDIPAGIVGIDPDGIVVLCNATWTELAGASVSILDRSIETTAPENVLLFIGQVRNKGRHKERVSIGSASGILSGVVMTGAAEEKGTIMVFVREDDLI
jgi:two-component system, NtrC family, sensor kinase